MAVFHLAEFVAFLRVIAVIRHPHHQVGQLLVVQWAGTPDVIAQVIVELLPGGRPDQRQTHTQGLGQRLGQFHVYAPGVARVFKTVGGEVLIDRHFQFTGGDHFVIVANLRLHRLAAQPHSADQYREQAHGSLLDVDAVQISTHRPQGFLAQVIRHFRHVDPTITHRAVAYSFDEPLITGIRDIEHAQIGGDATGLGFQAMTGRAVLVVGRRADFHRLIVLRGSTVRVHRRPAIGIERYAGILDRGQALGGDGLRHHIAVGPDGTRTDKTGQQPGHEQGVVLLSLLCPQDCTQDLLAEAIPCTLR
eukprot:Opistho-1_new@23718